MSRAFHDAFAVFEPLEGVDGAGLVDPNGHVVHAVGAHGGRAPETIGVHLPRVEYNALEASVGGRFDEEIFAGDAGALLLRHFGPERWVVYALVAAGQGLGPIRHALKVCARAVEESFAAEGVSVSPKRERLEDVRQFRGSSGLGQDLEPRS